LTIRALESRDLEAILTIQAACPEIAQWTAWDYDRVARGDIAGWVATENSNVREEVAADGAGAVRAPVAGAVRAPVAGDGAAEVAGEVAGFLVARRLSTELEILNFAVEFNSRRCGIGAALLAQALNWARTFQATQAILEVRASNLSALRFYERHKFEVVGRRPRYYTAPVEDALLLTATLT
jgi:ribosomal-protein-alanine N-acetyltransferase